LPAPSFADENYTGRAVFRFGLKNGKGTTVAVVVMRLRFDRQLHLQLGAGVGSAMHHSAILLVSRPDRRGAVASIAEFYFVARRPMARRKPHLAVWK
jgi:hypothetical protein